MPKGRTTGQLHLRHKAYTRSSVDCLHTVAPKAGLTSNFNERNQIRRSTADFKTTRRPVTSTGSCEENRQHSSAIRLRMDCVGQSNTWIMTPTENQTHRS